MEQVLLSLLLIISTTFDPIWASERDKRSLANFYGVIRCATGQNPLRYNGYGCFCGKGGSGQPVDQIDRCCQLHDQCYDALKRQGICNEITAYARHYYWDCVRGHSLYRFVGSSYPISSKSVAWDDQKRYPICKHNRSQCGSGLCICDVEAALCFAANQFPTSKPKCRKS